jgi:hypothetical protein
MFHSAVPRWPPPGAPNFVLTLTKSHPRARGWAERRGGSGWRGRDTAPSNPRVVLREANFRGSPTRESGSLWLSVSCPLAVDVDKAVVSRMEKRGTTGNAARSLSATPTEMRIPRRDNRTQQCYAPCFQADGCDDFSTTAALPPSLGQHTAIQRCHGTWPCHLGWFLQAAGPPRHGAGKLGTVPAWGGSVPPILSKYLARPIDRKTILL